MTKKSVSEAVDQAVKFKAVTEGLTYVEAYEALTAENPKIKEVLAAGKPVSASAERDRKEALDSLVSRVKEIAFSGIEGLTFDTVVDHLEDNGHIPQLSDKERKYLKSKFNESLSDAERELMGGK